MFDTALRSHRDRLLRPAVRALGGRVTPNTISIAGFAAGIACAALALHQQYGAAVVMWAINRTLDGLDGAVAREHDCASDFGAYLDLLLDFTIYAAVPIALVSGRPATPGLWLALALLLAAFYVNACSWMYPSVIATRQPATSTIGDCSRGLVEGAETAVFYTVFLIFPPHLTVLFPLLAILVMITVVQRLIRMRD